MRTGLFFGSFNPPHIGHLAIANYMIEFTDIEEIWFVVSPHNPLKEKEILLDDTLRLEMMQAALRDDPRFKVSDVEFSLPRPSYSIDTLEFLKHQYPDRELIILMGSDGLELFHRWKDNQKLVGKFQRYVYPRPDYPVTPDNIENGKLINAPMLEISSTFIRESIAAGKDVRYFVPAPVWKLITEKKLYQTQ